MGFEAFVIEPIAAHVSNPFRPHNTLLFSTSLSVSPWFYFVSLLPQALIFGPPPFTFYLLPFTLDFLSPIIYFWCCFRYLLPHYLFLQLIFYSRSYLLTAILSAASKFFLYHYFIFSIPQKGANFFFFSSYDVFWLLFPSPFLPFRLIWFLALWSWMALRITLTFSKMGSLISVGWGK